MFPSKKIIPLLVACIVAIGAIIFAIYETKSKEEYKADKKNIISIDNIAKLSSDSDSDMDGLKDWEESLWKTDPNNKDTDGDGTSDGEEITLGRNPTIKGPNDKQKIETSTTSETQTKDESLTDTDIFARNLFTDYMTSRGTNKMSETEIFQMIKDNVNTSTVLPDTFSMKDIRIANAEDTESIKTYGNAMGLIIKRNFQIKLENEFQLLDQAINNNDPEVLKKLDPTISAYKKTLSEFLLVECPKSASNIHLRYINDINKIIIGMTGIRNFGVDPVKSMGNLLSYPQTAKEYIETIKNVYSYFTNKNITYKPEEYGYIFSHKL